MIRNKICGIYMIENLIDKKKYIGQSKNIKSRMYSHRHFLKTNTHANKFLQESWNYHGVNNFKFEIIEVCEDCDLDYYEKLYVEKYKTANENFGYNQTSGGCLGAIKTTSYIENMRKSQKSIPILQIDRNGNIIKEWTGAREAGKSLNYSQSNIWSCLHRNMYSYKGYIWIFKSEYDNSFNLYDYIKSMLSIPIVQYTLDNEYIRTWSSTSEAGNALNIDKSSITNCSKGKSKTSKGYIWKYDKL